MDNIRKKLILFLTIIAFISCNISNLIPPLTVNAEENTIKFEDSYLEGCIAENLGKSSGSLTATDLEDIGEISIDLSVELTSLEGLQYCKNLSSFVAKVNSSDISQLSGLTNLTNLVIYDDNISDLSFLKNLTNLNYLTIQAHSLTNVDDLQYLTNASSIGITSPNITSLECINNLHNLISLYIDCDNLTTIDGFQDLHRLQNLHIENSSVEDFSPLNTINTLTTASLNNSQNNLNALKYLKNIETLSISGKGISSLNGIRDCGTLMTLSLNDTSISNVDEIQYLPNLINLTISSCPITHLEPHKVLKNLISLYLNDLKLDNYDLFETTTYLTNLAINNCRLTKIPSLTNLKSLNSLNLEHNFIESLNGIEHLTSANYITLENNNIHDLTPLLDLANNKSIGSNYLILNLSYNSIPTTKDYLDKFSKKLDGKIDVKCSNQKTNMHLNTINSNKFIYTTNSETSYVTSYKLFSHSINSIAFSNNISLGTDFNTVLLYDSNLDEYYNLEHRVNDNTLEIQPIYEFPNPDHDLYLFIGSDTENDKPDYVIPITITEEHLSADVNQDGRIDIEDLSIVANDYNKMEKDSEEWNSQEDCIRDGIIDIYDLCYISSKLAE